MLQHASQAGHGAQRHMLIRRGPTPVLRTRPSPEGEGYLHTAVK